MSRILLIVAVILFILEGLGVSPVPNQIAWGLACTTLAALV